VLSDNKKVLTGVISCVQTVLNQILGRALPSTELTNTAYDILKVLGKDADFLYDTIDKYIKDAQNANRHDLVEMWQVIKKDRQKHIHMLKEALEKEIHG
jgi:DNA-binding ferritin-like protein